jgi:hypothetical protein
MFSKSVYIAYYLAPVLVDTGMTVHRIEWNTTGSILAVAGSQRLAQQVHPGTVVGKTNSVTLG